MRGLLYLVILTMAALLAVVLLAPDDTALKNTENGALLLPEMADKINHVDRVEIFTAGSTVVATLVKSADRWQLEQMSGYQADWPKLHALLNALARAQVVEVKTDKVEYYARLGVADIDAEDADGLLLKLSAGDLVSAILIGHKAQKREGRYVRLQGAAASALVDQRLDVPSDPLDWIDRRIIDINASEVAEAEIVGPKQGRILVTRISADQTDFDLVGMPLEREIKSSWAVNSLASILTVLDLETVRPVGDLDWSNAIRMRTLLFSGMEIMTDVIEVNGEYLMRLHASQPGAKFAPRQENEEIAKQALADVAKQVDAINQRVDGWVYGIAKAKYDAMAKTPEDLLKPIESS